MEKVPNEMNPESLRERAEVFKDEIGRRVDDFCKSKTEDKGNFFDFNEWENIHAELAKEIAENNPEDLPAFFEYVLNVKGQPVAHGREEYLKHGLRELEYSGRGMVEDRTSLINIVFNLIKSILDKDYNRYFLQKIVQDLMSDSIFKKDGYNILQHFAEDQEPFISEKISILSKEIPVLKEKKKGLIDTATDEGEYRKVAREFELKSEELNIYQSLMGLIAKNKV